MKLLSIFLFVVCMQASATSHAQKVSITVKNKSIPDVLKQIGTQCGYEVIFTDDIFHNAPLISLNLKSVEISTALNECLKGRYTYEIMESVIVVKQPPAIAPPIIIKGRVLDGNGNGVAATVTIKGTKRSVPTDDKGYFTITLDNANNKLLVTGVNIETKEVNPDGQSELTIYVKFKTTDVDPVTVTAYGIERKTKEIGYSVAKVSGAEINKANTSNLLTGLIGKVSGMTITTQSSDMSPQMRILLRGIRSFGQNSNNQPLFIFNGAPISFGTDQNAATQVLEFINNFNPADIEDVTILKGANGTALYGPEGVNGVIIITTKKAAKGIPVINFRNNTSFQRVDFRQDRRQRIYGLGSGQVDQDGNGIYDPRGVGSWGPKYDGSMVPIGYPDENGELQQVTYSDKNDFRKFFNTAITNRSNLSFSQADATSSYYLGLGYTTQTGLLPMDKQNQLNVLMNSVKKFSNRLNVSFNINYSRINSDRGQNLEGVVRNLPTFIPLLEYKDYKNSYWGNHNRYFDYISPYEALAIARSKGTTNALNGSLIFEIKPFDWLTVREQPGINYSGLTQKYTSEPLNFAEFARQNSAKAYDRFAALGETVNSNTSLNNDLILSTVQKAGDFLLRLNVGNTIRQNYTKMMRAGASLIVPVYNLAFAFAGANAGEDAVLSRTISAFGTASAGYKDMLFLEVTGRNEWDSKRAKVARGKDFYASANTSLILKEALPFLKDEKWLSTVRLRASLALSANMNITPYQSERILTLAEGYPYVDPNSGNYLLSYSFLANNPNPNLKPERVLSQEYGINFGLFNNRVTGDVTYYHQINNSVILDVKTSYLSGYPTTDNAGKFMNQGWEFDLNISPLIKLPNDINISVQARGALNNNKVVSLTPVYKGLFPVFDPGGQRFYARTGKGAYEFATADWKRNEAGKVIVDNTTGMPIPQDYGTFTIEGNTLPRYSASVGLNISWRRFTASVFADHLGGYDHLFSTWQGFLYGTDPRTLYNDRKPYVFPNSVYDDGTGKYVENTSLKTSNANLDLYQNHAQVSKLGLVSAAFLKIREVAFQYSLPVRTNSLKELSFSVYGRDLFAFYSKNNLFGDPGLIRGPGFRDPTTSSNGSQPPPDPIGGSSEAATLPGSVLFGFTIGALF